MAIASLPQRSSVLAAWFGKRGGALAIFVLLFVIWEVAVRVTGVKEYLLPPPSSRGLASTHGNSVSRS